jgi:serine O-acetyltransferase
MNRPRFRLFADLRTDLRAKAAWLYESTSRRAILRTLLTDGTPAMVWYRLMQAARRWRLAPLEMLFNRINSACCGCVIGRGAEFGPGLVLVHANGVVINGAVRGGANVVIEHQVTIGAEKRQSPVIGDGVFLGAGAKVVGPVTIGAGAKVGANAVVVHDVPAGATVVGIPARVVTSRGVRTTAIEGTNTAIAPIHLSRASVLNGSADRTTPHAQHLAPAEGFAPGAEG